jgi:transposase
MVAAYRAGASLRQVAQDFNESKSTVQRWVAFVKGKRLDRVDFHDKQSGTKQPKNKSSTKLEKRVLQLRKYLKEKSILGLHGADAIIDEIFKRGDQNVPTRRTTNNILKHNGMIGHRTRIRRSTPPPDWYLQDLQKQKVELDTFDIVESLYHYGGQEVQLFNGLSLHGNLLHSSAVSTVTTENTILTFVEHWK